MAMHTFTRFMFVCIWKRMRQMDDNLIVRIATIQAIVMSLLLTAATWLQLYGQHFGNQVSSLFLLHKPPLCRTLLDDSSKFQQSLQNC